VVIGDWVSGALSEAARQVAGIGVRNVATIFALTGVAFY
jgi:hypothetical protein